MLGIHSVGCKGSNLDRRGSRVQKAFNPLSSTEFALIGEFLEALFASALRDLRPPTTAFCH
jgi:hypothetical protein